MDKKIIELANRLQGVDIFGNVISLDMAIEQATKIVNRDNNEIEMNKNSIPKDTIKAIDKLLYFINAYVNNTNFKSEFKKSFYPSIIKQLETTKKASKKQLEIILKDLIEYSKDTRKTTIKYSILQHTNIKYPTVLTIEHLNLNAIDNLPNKYKNK